MLLLGSDRGRLEWVRSSYPDSEVLDLAATSSIDVIEKKLADFSFDQLLWIAPDVNTDAVRAIRDSESVVGQQEEGVLVVFRIIKALLRRGYADKKLQWTFVISQTQRVTGRDPIQPAHAGIVGLVGGLAEEYPQWNLRLLDLDSLASVSARECLSLPYDKLGNLMAHRKGEWFKQGLAVIGTLPEMTPAYRQNGVYVIIGGASGIGAVWSRYMIQNYQANIVWIGRREYNTVIEEKIKSLSRLGPAPLYISADARDLSALERAYKTILTTYPAIHGVAHSAMDLHSQSIARMDETAFRATFSAKVDVSVNMDRVFGAQELDFMLFFSSIISFVRSPGQANYSAGCTFKDSFAQKLQEERPYPVKIVNWGYWGKVGPVADESSNKIMAKMGVGVIEPHEGMAFLEEFAGSAMRQVALIKTLSHLATTRIKLSEAVTYYPQTAATASRRVERVLAEQLEGKPLDALEAGLPTREMNDLITEVLASSLMSLGLFSNGVRRIAELSLAKQPAPFYERWLSASIHYLQQQQLLSGELKVNREVRKLEDLWSEWEANRSAWAADPNLQARITLLEVCLKGLPGVLSGKQCATDVLFPNSSMQLVEGVNCGNSLADHFSEALCETLTACIENQLQAGKENRIRILEIGAGSGGMTAKLLPALQRYPVEEYNYTDVSKAFLMLAEKRFQPMFPALTTAIFDVSRPLAPQSIAAGHYDFAIAANVLHATRDIRETLRNAKSALKNQGVLLLNELSAWSLFHHLTFGLLEEWWLYEDEAARLPGGPALSPDKWREILAEEGFESIVFPAREAHKLGQQIIVAVSNGWTRQRIVEHAPLQPSAGADVPVTKSGRPVSGVSSSGELAQQTGIDYVRRIIIDNLSDALKLDAAVINNDAPLTDYGVDSIIGVNLVRTMSEALQIELDPASLFEYNTVNRLAEYILNNFRQQIAGQLAQVQSTSRQSSDATSDAPAEPGGGFSFGHDNGLHPLLHTNTSTLRQQSYSSSLTGAEFFLRDHQVVTNGHGKQAVLPEAAYLEMARAAIEQAACIPQETSVVELQDIVWGHPMAVAGHKEVTIALLENDSEQVHYEVYSGEAGHETIHCQGRVSISDGPIPSALDIDELQGQMREGELDPDEVYAVFAKMGLRYGPAHQAITTIYRGDKQLLARLSLPQVVATSASGSWSSGYSLHPSVTTGALQAGVRLAAETAPRPGARWLPLALERLRVVSPSTREMFAWARASEGSVGPEDTVINIDIDLLDAKGSVCAQMRRLSLQVDDAAIEPAGQIKWLFSTEERSLAGAGAVQVARMQAAETIELFLKQEAAFQLQRSIDEVSTEQSYFALGFTSAASTTFIEAINRLFDMDLSPSVLFDHRDIRSLAAHLTETYPAKILALTAVRQEPSQTYSAEQWQRQGATLVPLPRRTCFSERLARSSHERTNVAKSGPEKSRDQILEAILWKEASLDDSYEKMTF
jgi:acyl carrier protein/SAM-dependent methyltransferase